jgi:DNA-binding NarL/FixJ family response regulator
MYKSIIIVDDHEVILMSLKIIIQSRIPNTEIKAVNSITEFYQIIKQKCFDLYILDISMPDNDWIATVENIFTYHPNANILIHTMYNEVQYVRRAFTLGVNGYVVKTSSIEELGNAVSTLLSGKKFITPELNIKLASELGRGKERSANPCNLLSPREFEVSIELLNGSEINAISKKMNVVPSTISSFKRRIFEKLGIKNYHQLSLLARQFGLIK